MICTCPYEASVFAQLPRSCEACRVITGQQLARTMTGAEYARLSDAFSGATGRMAPAQGFTPADEPRGSEWLSWLSRLAAR